MCMEQREQSSVRAPQFGNRANPHASTTPRRSLVRSAITLLLKQPPLVDAMQPPYLFSALRQPGISLLMELIAICRARPVWATLPGFFAGAARKLC